MYSSGEVFRFLRVMGDSRGFGLWVLIFPDVGFNECGWVFCFYRAPCLVILFPVFTLSLPPFSFYFLSLPLSSPFLLPLL